MGLSVKNFNIMGGTLKNLIFRGGGGKKNKILGELHRKSGLGQSPDLMGGG